MRRHLSEEAREAASEALCRARHPWLWRTDEDESCDACDCAITAVEEGDDS